MGVVGREKIKLDGSHLMLDCFGCPEGKLDDEGHIQSFLEGLPAHLGMRKFMEPCTLRYAGTGGWDRGGITGFVCIAESHISIHTYPHDGFFSADVYSCKPFDKEKAIAFTKKYFEFTDARIQSVRRDIEIVRELNMARKG